MGNFRSIPDSPHCDDIQKFSHFSPEDIRSWSSSFRSIFPNQKISISELEHQLKDFFPFGNSKPFCKLLFKTINISSSQNIDFHELLIAFSILKKGSNFEKLRWLFRFYDCDNDGVISKSEMCYVAQSIVEMTCSTVDVRVRVEELVNEVFEEVENLSGFLTFDDFRTLAQKKSDAFNLLSDILN